MPPKGWHFGCAIGPEPAGMIRFLLCSTRPPHAGGSSGRYFESDSAVFPEHTFIYFGVDRVIDTSDVLKSCGLLDADEIEGLRMAYNEHLLVKNLR